MGVARKFGTICYRSRSEFDARFSWAPEKPGRPITHARNNKTGNCSEPGHWEFDDENGHKFEIEQFVFPSLALGESQRKSVAVFVLEPQSLLCFCSYLDHAAKKFVGGVGNPPYDPNCYLCLSQVCGTC